jgi:hypothetical protein
VIQLTYISTATARMIDDDIQRILRVSRVNNAPLGVTGMLLYNGKRFLQTLEGKAEDVSAIYRRIEADSRHHGLVLLSSSDIGERTFATWAMAGLRVEGDSDSEELVRQVEALTAGIPDRAVRAHFRSFAAVRPVLRSAA